MNSDYRSFTVTADKPPIARIVLDKSGRFLKIADE